MLLCASNQLKCGAQELSDTGSAASQQTISASDERVRNILLVLSCSYAMRHTSTNGPTLMTQGKAIVEQLLQVLPSDINIGLRTYGQGQTVGYMESDCRDTKLIEPIVPKNKKKILEDLEGLQPIGMSPIGYTIVKSLEGDFETVSGSSLLILIAGKGEDTCSANVTLLAKQLPLVLQGKPIKILAMSLNKNDQKERANALLEFAEASGGRYYRFDAATDLVRDVKDLCSRKHGR